MLPFLDVKVHRTSTGFKYSVYRKPTNVCSYIHYYSNHSDKIKLGTFSSMFLRAFRVCSPEFLQHELDTIFNISKKLKYPYNFIERALYKARKTFYLMTYREPFNNQNLLVLPYNSAFKNVPRFYKAFNIKFSKYF